MKLQFAGCGSFASGHDTYQSNVLITAESGRHLLLDCGMDAKHSLPAIGIAPADIHTVYISHLHADHVGGLEWLAFTTYFSPDVDRPLLYSHASVMERLWERSLAGGLEYVQGGKMDISDYFRCRTLHDCQGFSWEGLQMTLVPAVHLVSPAGPMYSYGLYITPQSREEGEGWSVYFTADTTLTEVLDPHYGEADVIFHDCETTPFRSTVHAHYDDLLTLPDEIRAKMWLYHYADAAPQDPVADGFLGFATRGQVFEFLRS